jgi:hypothetical protein
MFDKGKYHGSDLHTDVRTLIEDCRRDATTFAARVRAGKTGYGMRGRVEALTKVACWLEKIAGNSLMLVDLATNVNDCIICLQQSVDDEREDAKPVRGRQGDTCEQHRRMTMAKRKADAYIDALEVLSHLLRAHYPGEEFPLTLTAGNMSYDELERLVEPSVPSIKEPVYS